MILPTPIIFVPECHADTALTLTLLGENQPSLRASEADRLRLRIFVDHEQGIGNVGRNMQEQWDEFSNARYVVGLVDLDKRFGQQPYLRQFTEVLGGNMERKHHPYVLLQHITNRTHYLIVVNPAFETWLIEREAELGKIPADFGLPTDFKALKKYCKNEEAKYDPNLRNLLDAIATANMPAYRPLADFVTHAVGLASPLY